MAQFVIMGQVGKDKRYLASDTRWWGPCLKDAKLFSTQEQAESELSLITSEPDSKLISVLDHTTHWDAPNTLRRLAELSNAKDHADVKISICAVSLVVLSSQRWHVEDGKGKTKRLS